VLSRLASRCGVLQRSAAMPAPTRPSLVSLAPLPEAHFPLTSSPFVVGRARDAGARLDHPLVQPRHAVLLEREDGWWLSGGNASVLVNDRASTGDRLLQSGDRLQLAPGATLQFDDGAPEATPPVAGTAWQPTPGRRKRRRGRTFSFEGGGRGVLIGVLALLVLGAFAAFGWYGWKTYQERPQETPVALSPADAAVFDSLLGVTLDHIERGNILLEVGAAPAALTEFATGLSVISTSRLRDDPYVKRRLDQLRTSIGEVYRAQKLTVPPSFATSGSAGALQGQGLTAALSVAQFAASFDALRSSFQARFGAPLEITGRDHPEHLSLYGAGGAIDLRSKTMNAQQVQFVVDAARRTGIRVKDFSKDAVLKAQIQAANAAGLRDRASTGLHLHIDRFANRRDRWTVP